MKLISNCWETRSILFIKCDISNLEKSNKILTIQNGRNLMILVILSANCEKLVQFN